MVNPEAKQLFDKGNRYLNEGNVIAALSCFEKALSLEEDPLISSCFAFCIAKERGEVKKAIAFCNEAIAKEPENSLHYLNLGRIYLLNKEKNKAIDIFRKGLHYQNDQLIVDELQRLGTRKPPIVRFLKRTNFINKYLGMILSRLKLR